MGHTLRRFSAGRQLRHRLSQCRQQGVQLLVAGFWRNNWAHDQTASATIKASITQLAVEMGSVDRVSAQMTYTASAVSRTFGMSRAMTGRF
jgi:hypothetical protein